MSLRQSLCRKRKHLGLVQIYHSSCQKNLFSCNINRAPSLRVERWDLFLRGRLTGCLETPSKTGHAVHIMKPQSQTNVLFKEPKRCLLQSAYSPSLLFLSRPAALCVISTFECWKHAKRKQKHSWQEALPCHVKEQIGRHVAKWTNCADTV